MADETYSWIDDLPGDTASSTLNAANETHRLCSKTRDAVVDAENRLSEMKGEMHQLEMNFVERNRHLMEQLQRSKGKRKECEKQNERLRRQMLHMVKLDTIKNQRISGMEDRLQSCEVKLQQYISELDLDQRMASIRQVDEEERAPTSGKERMMEAHREHRDSHIGETRSMMDSCPADALRDKSDGPMGGEDVTEGIRDAELDKGPLSLQAFRDIRSECAQWMTSLARYQDTAITHAVEGHPILDCDRDVRAAWGVMAGYVSQFSKAIKCAEQLSGKGERSLPRKNLQTCFRALLQLIQNIQAACAGIQDAQLRMQHQLEQQDVTYEENTKDLRQQIASLQSAASTSKIEEKVHFLSGSVAHLENKLAKEMEKSKKAMHHIQRIHSKKSKELLKRIAALVESCNQIKEESENRGVLATLYRELTQLYDQNLKIIEELQSNTKPQHVRDLRVRLEKGIQQQEHFTNYIATIVRRDTGIQNSEHKVREKVPDEQRTPARSDTIVAQRDVCPPMQDIRVEEAQQMTAEYQELWKRYRKQTLRFRQLQKFLKASSKKRDEASASDDAIDGQWIDKQCSGGPRCHFPSADTAIAPHLSNKRPIVATRRRRSEIVYRDRKAHGGVLSEKDDRDNERFFSDGHSDDLLGATDRFLFRDSFTLDPSLEDVTLPVSPPSIRPSLSSSTSSAHRRRLSFGRVDWKSDM